MPTVSWPWLSSWLWPSACTPGAGRLIASRLPGNSVGWLLCLTGLSLAATMLTEQYALYGLATAPGSVPAARLAGWCSDVLAALTLVQLLFLVLLFPDGRLPSHRWRPVLHREHPQDDLVA